jgi:lactaldehyde dehydrogenase/glycolaldehyde dehydrogenase
MMTTIAAEFPHAGAHIDGSWAKGEGEPMQVMRPRTGETIVELPQASPAQVRSALESSHRAQVGWARTTSVERGALLRQIADVIAANRGQLAALLVEEMGKRHNEADDELAFAESFVRFNAEWDTRLEGDVLPGDVPGEQIQLLRVPIGVVAAICPWNFPLAVLCRKLAPALLTGNTVVVKPSEISPLSTLALFEMITDAVDLPAGVLNLVVGGRQVGQALVADELTSLISFTGHRDTGKSVMAAASANMTRVSLELGGKAPAIVWRDADVQLAVDSILAARHTNCGQVCTSAERVLAHPDVIDEFTERYSAAVSQMRIGDPTGDVDLGPMASAQQVTKAQAALSTALAEGATVVAGGTISDAADLGPGYWQAPTVLRDVTPGMTIMREETFGPITPIVAVDRIDEALAIANDSRYGLSAYVFSEDYRTVMRTVDELQFGEIYVNRTLGESVHAHHTGWKESGMGGEDGKWGMLRYTQIKTVYHRFGRA